MRMRRKHTRRRHGVATENGKKEADRSPPPEGQSVQIVADASPLGRQGWRAEWRMMRLIISSGSFRVQAKAVFWCAPDGARVGGPLWEALWPYMSVPEILQVRAAAQAWNDASKYGPYWELFPDEARAGRW